MVQGMNRRDVLRAGAALTAGTTLAAPTVFAQGTGGNLRFAFRSWAGNGRNATGST
jgi:hypothetical protein